MAQFPEYLEPLAGHLLWVKARHWEKAMRELAATAAAGECLCWFLAPAALPWLLPLQMRHDISLCC